jgi:hypothetical protein
VKLHLVAMAAALLTLLCLSCSNPTRPAYEDYTFEGYVLAEDLPHPNGGLVTVRMRNVHTTVTDCAGFYHLDIPSDELARIEGPNSPLTSSPATFFIRAQIIDDPDYPIPSATYSGQLSAGEIHRQDFLFYDESDTGG